MEECCNFAKSLEAIRAFKHATISEFSEELDIPKPTLQDVLKNETTSLHTDLHIAKHLNVPLSTLTGEVISSKNLDALASLLNCFEWFALLPLEDQKEVAAHIRAIMEVLQK